MKLIISPLVLIASIGLSYADPIDRPAFKSNELSHNGISSVPRVPSLRRRNVLCRILFQR